MPGKIGIAPSSSPAGLSGGILDGASDGPWGAPASAGLHNAEHMTVCRKLPYTLDGDRVFHPCRNREFRYQCLQFHLVVPRPITSCS